MGNFNAFNGLCNKQPDGIFTCRDLELNSSIGRGRGASENDFTVVYFQGWSLYRNELTTNTEYRDENILFIYLEPNPTFSVKWKYPNRCIWHFKETDI